MVYDKVGRPQMDLDCSDNMNCISVGSRGQDTRLVKTTDGGYNWLIIFEDLQKEIYNEHGQVVDVIPTKYNGAVCIDFVTPDFVVIGNKEGQITISKDGGVTWDSTNLNTIQDIKVVRFTDALSGIALTNNLIFLTTDSGESWNNITSNLNYSGAVFFQSAFMKDDFIYAGGFFSTDKGTTWTKSNPINNIHGMYGVYFIDSREGWCSGRRQIVQNQAKYADVILHTTNSGLDWNTQLDTTIEPDFALTGGIYFANKNEGITYGEGGKIWRTTNGGKNWNLDKSFPFLQSDHFTKLVCPDSHTNKLLANVWYRGEIWMYEDLTSVNEKEINVNNINIFPNPSTDFITIQFSNKELQLFAAEDKVQIFDVLGIEVGQSSLIDNATNINSQSGMIDLLKIDVSHLPAGVYFIKIGNKVEKFVKM